MKERAARIEYIRGAVNAAKKDDTNQNFYTIKNWRGAPQYKKIISLDVEYLMFRIENSRTEIQQLGYIRRNGLPKNFFNDPEASRVQEAQERILIEMIKSKDTGIDFWMDLEKRGQEYPAIITFDGFIVNGNRRVAALKDLKERYISCVVLNDDANPRDIYILEQQLQISKDFREDYHWLNELRNIRKGLEDKRLALTEKELADNLRLDERELKEKKFMLELVDAFLLWRGIPDQYDYHLLNDANQIFIELEKARRNKIFRSDPNKYNDLKNAIFTLLESRPKQRSLYYHVSNLIKHFDQVKNKLSVKPSNTEEEQKIDNTNTLDELIDVGKEEIRESLFNYSLDATNNSKLIVETIEDVKAENKEKEDAEFVYDAVNNALRQLTGLVIDSDTTKIESIKQKLEEIIVISNELIKEINSSNNNP